VVRILVIDDEAMLRSGFVRGLSKIPGAEVVEAADLPQALAHLDVGAADVIVSDIDMPGRSGLELLGELGRRGMRTPVIFVSGYLRAYGSQIPPNANVEVMEKPVSLDELRAAVARRAVKARPSGEFLPFSVADYLQLAGLGRHSVVVEVERDGVTVGQVVVWAGETWSAKDERGRGEEALRRLAFSKGTIARCRTLTDEPKGERDLPGHWEMVLLEAARQADELGVVDESWEAQQSAPPRAPMAAPAPAVVVEPPLPRRSPEDVAFDEAWEDGVEALLKRDYPRALRAFIAARELRPSDTKVEANIRRLTELGVRPDNTDADRVE
jgi:CheY-like chemotaxis protein